MARENKSNEVGLYVDWVPLVCVGQLGTRVCSPCKGRLAIGIYICTNYHISTYFQSHFGNETMYYILKINPPN